MSGAADALDGLTEDPPSGRLRSRRRFSALRFIRVGAKGILRDRDRVVRQAIVVEPGMARPCRARTIFFLRARSSANRRASLNAAEKIRSSPAASLCRPRLVSRARARRSRPRASSRCRLASPKCSSPRSTRAPRTELSASLNSCSTSDASSARSTSHEPDAPHSHPISSALSGATHTRTASFVVSFTRLPLTDRVRKHRMRGSRLRDLPCPHGPVLARLFAGLAPNGEWQGS